MNLILCDLKNLQAVDDQLRQARQALEEGEATLGQAGARLKAFESKLAAARADLAAMQARHRELEGEVAGLAVKQKNNETRQMNIKSDQEYAALTREAGFLAGRINELEDETLELLDRIEKREVEISDLALVVTEESATYGRLAAVTERARETSRNLLAELTVRREATVAALPPAQLRQYDEIFKNRAGRAVTAAAAGLCLACRLGFPPQVFNELQRNEKILTCPNCGRIIYWQDHPDFAEEPRP